MFCSVVMIMIDSCLLCSVFGYPVFMISCHFQQHLKGINFIEPLKGFDPQRSDQGVGVFAHIEVF